MKITIINGSPRGKKSNSKMLTDQFLAGLAKANPATKHETFYLVNRYQTEDAIEACQQSDVILMAFPLYTDAMPAVVKLFFERMPSLPGKKIVYLVQSGFPEAIHCFYLEKYLEKFTLKMGALYLGTATRGNVEGIQDRSAWMNRGLYTKYYALGKYFGATGELDPKILCDLKKPFVMSPVARVACSLVLKTGISDYGWNQRLKANHAFGIRHARPYEIKINPFEN